MGFLWSQLFVTPAYPTKSFAGKTVIVTGSNTGLGKEAARHFARLGAAKVILAVRNTKAGDAAKVDIEKSLPQQQTTRIEVWPLDLSSYESVKSFAARASKLDRIDVLLENAGIAPANFKLMEGHESMITVNVISTFLLAMLLLPKLKATSRAYTTEVNLTIVSSEVHSFAKFPERNAANIFEELDDEKKFNQGDRYPVSKLLEVLPVREIAPQLKDSGVILNMTNPGLCHSELAREGGLFLAVMKFFLARSAEVGSRTLIAAASLGPESHGKYINDGVVSDGALSSFARSDEGAVAGRKVWTELSEILEQIAAGCTAAVSS